MDLCSNDLHFNVGSNCRTLDFTVYFEESILLIGSFLLFVLVSFYISISTILKHKNAFVVKRAWSSPLLLVKLVLGVVYVVVSIAVVIMVKGKEVSKLSIGAASIQMVASLGFLALTITEHLYTASPSTIHALSSMVLGLFQAAYLRTLSAIGYQEMHSATFVIEAVSCALLLSVGVVETLLPKRGLLKEEYLSASHEETSSYISRLFFTSLFPLFIRGRLVPLTLENLGEIPYTLSSSYTKIHFLPHVSQKTGEIKILKALMAAFGWNALGPVLPRIIMIIATFTQVYLVQDMVLFVEDPRIPSVRGWALVGGFVCVYGVLSFSTAVYWEKVYAFAVQARSALVGQIFTKSLLLSSTSARRTGGGAATTYMSQDVEKIVEGIGFVYEMAAAAVSIVIACLLLWQQAQWGMLSSLGFVFFILGVTGSLAGSIDSAQTKWMTGVDNRIKLMTSLFSQMLPIKLSAYEVPLMNKINELRRKELAALTGFYKMVIIAASMTNTAAGFVGLICLGTYTGVLKIRGELETLSISRVFTILTVVNLFVGPIIILGELLPNIIAAFTAISRLERFANMEDKPVYEDDKISVEFLQEHPDVLIKITDASFAWGAEEEVAIEKEDPKVKDKAKKKRKETQKILEEDEEEGEKAKDSPLVPVLVDISLELKRNNLYMVVGPVASGKSSLLLSILQESVRLKGSVKVAAQTASFASQTAFIFPGSVKANVIMASTYDPEWYSQVISACALLPDIQGFPDKDQTLLGERGHTLSGGQKQRIALARAVYCKAEMVLLDDTFSALDGKSEQQVFTALFGPSGLLKNTLTLLVTHNIHHLHAADGVIVLDSGKVTHVGTLHQLQEQKSAFISIARAASLSTQYHSADEVDDKREVERLTDSEPKAFIEDDEILNTVSLGFKGYQFFFKAGGYKRVWLCLALLLLWTASTFGIQGYYKAFSEKADVATLAKWMGGLAGLCFANVIALVIAFAWTVLVQSKYSSPSIFNSELLGVFSSPPSFAITTPAGKILNRFSQDIQQLDFQFPLAILSLIIAVCHVLGVVIFFIIGTPWIGLSIPIMAPIYYFLITFYVGTSKQLQKLDVASKSPLYTLFSTTMSSLTTVRAYKAESFFQQQNDAFLDRSQTPFYLRYAGIRFLRVFLAFITFLLSVGISIIAVALRGSTSAGFLGLSLSNLTTVTEYLNMLLMAYALAENGVVSISRIHEFANLKPEEDNDIASEPFEKDEEWPRNGDVEFKSYSMKYKDEQALVLDDISFRISGGLKLGICGRSGSGKSTTVLSLFRAVDPTFVSGTIAIDGRDIFQMKLEDLRSSMSIVTQEPFLWHGTLRDNLDLTTSCTENEIWAALKTVGLDTVINELEGKLEWMVVDSESFSKGQRQLVCLARALLRKRKILVLDESTSSVDHLTDEKIRSVIEDQVHGTTVISVAHRISTIINFDRILVMDKGHVAEFGTPQELLLNENSLFSGLAISQGVHPFVEAKLNLLDSVKEGTVDDEFEGSSSQ